jgi:hypothetical protein
VEQSNSPRLAEQLWSIVAPHLDIEQLQTVAQEVIEIFEASKCILSETDCPLLWNTAYPYGARYSPVLEELPDDLDEFGDSKARITGHGAQLVRSIMQAATYTKSSITDIIHCFLEAGNTDENEMDAFCLEVLTEGTAYTLVKSHVSHTAKGFEIPKEETEDNEPFIMFVILACYALSSAFEAGGPFEGSDFKDFLEERPQ